ncbi:hypothetical protein OPW41_00765 [Vibrio europaeus]|uniref:EpsG family protein n=1 Tax=Vibrio europaeus TaxID=300876 RepID=A0A178JAR8_9VIBR|nr:hypothetical protein [Vibrio europaeus]MDC5703097.1 hypothetical protein [Vibrio europaeus]MDC5708671.1 hypothetical protein [Vibrio europaeus]MDC5712989.1 hypothetical protein [Vibrio europaeus]MDC5718002.1 hypothetical protein [Vibrio europaeus]MDC5725409.1 hypothetical protein [Vibrio europaeus]
MIVRVKSNEISLFIFYLVALLAVFLLEGRIQTWHQNDFSYWFSSDGSEYYRLYEKFSNSELSLLELLRLITVGMPIALLMLFDGNVAPVIVFANTIFFISLAIYGRKLNLKTSSTFLIIIMMPTLFFGFIAINKEIFLISGTLLFLSYYVSGSKRLLVLSVLVMLMSRSYMLAFYIYVMAVFPRNLTYISYKRLMLSMIAISMVCPLILSSGEFGTAEDLLAGSGTLAQFFGSGIRKGLYFLLYLPKYLFLIVMRMWSAYMEGLFGAYQANLRDFLLSLYSIALICWAFISIHRYKSYEFRFLIMGVFSPFPLMFSDIVHWRYYIFCLPFFMTYIVLRGRGAKMNINGIMLSK